MPLRLARVAAGVATAVGIVAIPTVYAMPSPIHLCVLAPPLNCVLSSWSGRMYVEGDSPMALVWLFTSFIIAPLLSLAAVWVVARGQRLLGILIATGAVVPNLLLFFGTYSFIPLHPLVLGLTVVTLVCISLVSDRRAGAPSIRQRLA